MRRVYIATRLENHAAHNRLRDALDALGVGLTYDWTAHGSVKHLGIGRIREVAIAETAGVTCSDLVVALLPGGRGTHAEIGIAIGAGVPVVLVTTDPADKGDGGATCAFYHHPGVVILDTADLDEVARMVAEAEIEGPARRTVRVVSGKHGTEIEHVGGVPR